MLSDKELLAVYAEAENTVFVAASNTEDEPWMVTRAARLSGLRAVAALIPNQTGPTLPSLEQIAEAIFDVRDDPYDMDEWAELNSTDRERYECSARAA